MQIPWKEKNPNHQFLFDEEERKKIPYLEDEMLLTKLYWPHIKNLKPSKNIILSCPLDTFIKRFKITSNVLDPVIDIIKKHKLLIAGGKLIDFFENKTLDESTNDYDLFQIRESNNIDLTSLGFIPSTNLDYLKEWIKDGIKIQHIFKLYACPEHIIEEFDIRACAICTDGYRIYWIKGALRDIRNKKIILTNPKINHNVFLRIIKYIKKGYDINIPDLTLASICLLDSISLNFSVNKMALTDRDFVPEIRNENNYIEEDDIEIAVTF